MMSLLLALMCTIPALAEGQIYFGVYQGTGSLTAYGTDKAETYDLAIHLTDPSLVGMQIRGIRVPVNANAKNTTDYKAWLTKELTLVSGKVVPDIVSVEVAPEGSWAEARLAEPYVIEEGGLYVGYTFTVSSVDAADASDANKKPVMTTAEENPEGLLIHTSRTYRKWVGLADLGSAAVVAILGGESVKAHAAILKAPDDLYTTIGKSITTTLTLVNHGTDAISNIDYEIEVGGETVSKHQSVALGGDYYGRYKTFSATIPAVANAGTYNAKFRITKVNGQDNEDPSGVTEQPVTYLSEIPVHKPLVEEYTGTWCQYCPRALAGMEKLSDTNGENFIGIAYHVMDEMSFTASAYLPADPSGLPSVFIDRVKDFVPISGQSDWESRRNIIAPANIEVRAEWADEAKTKIQSTSTTSFIRDFADNIYQLSYVLIANDLYDADWRQSNALSGSATTGDPYLDKYIKASNPIKGLHYNEVALDQATEKGTGLPGSLPSSVKGYVPYEHGFTFDIANNELPINKEKLEVVVVLLNTATGEVVNCNKAHVTDAMGIGEVESSTLKVESSTYDLAGRRIVKPTKGIYIENGKKIVK